MWGLESAHLKEVAAPWPRRLIVLMSDADGECVSVGLRRGRLRGGPAPVQGQPHHLHFQAINLMFVRFANRWGLRGRTVHADGEQVNRITGAAFTHNKSL